MAREKKEEDAAAEKEETANANGGGSLRALVGDKSSSSNAASSSEQAQAKPAMKKSSFLSRFRSRRPLITAQQSSSSNILEELDPRTLSEAENRTKSQSSASSSLEPLRPSTQDQDVPAEQQPSSEASSVLSMPQCDEMTLANHSQQQQQRLDDPPTGDLDKKPAALAPAELSSSNQRANTCKDNYSYNYFSSFECGQQREVAKLSTKEWKEIRGASKEESCPVRQALATLVVAQRTKKKDDSWLPDLIQDARLVEKVQSTRSS
jgi:hypothetical protein